MTETYRLSVVTVNLPTEYVELDTGGQSLPAFTTPSSTDIIGRRSRVHDLHITILMHALQFFRGGVV